MRDARCASYIGRQRRPSQDDQKQFLAPRLPELIKNVLSAIRDADGNGRLLHHKDLLYTLYKWGDFAEDNSTEAKKWVNAVIQDDQAVVVFAEKMTGESWSQCLGFDGLGDHVATRQTIAKVDSKVPFLDLTAFRERLDKISFEATLESEQLEIVNTFLNAWDKSTSANTD